MRTCVFVSVCFVCFASRPSHFKQTFNGSDLFMTCMEGVYGAELCVLLWFLTPPLLGTWLHNALSASLGRRGSVCVCVSSFSKMSDVKCC